MQISEDRNNRWILLLPIFLLAGSLILGLPAAGLSQEKGAGNVAESEEGGDEGFEDFLEDDFGGEASAGERVDVSDPLYYWNYAMYQVNDKLYFWALKPVAKGYKKVVPDIVRTGFKNFFHNLTTPVRAANCLLQGKGERLGNEVARFMYNTTVGVLGFGNPAQNDPRLQIEDDEDFGQTLAVYGIGDGVYIVWPLFGPSTLRDSVGMLGDRSLNPLSYVDPGELSAGISAFRQINGTSFRIGDYEALKDAAIVPYEAIRDAYLQNRKKRIAE